MMSSCSPFILSEKVGDYPRPAILEGQCCVQDQTTEALQATMATLASRIQCFFLMEAIPHLLRTLA